MSKVTTGNSPRPDELILEKLKRLGNLGEQEFMLVIPIGTQQERQKETQRRTEETFYITPSGDFVPARNAEGGGNA